MLMYLYLDSSDESPRRLALLSLAKIAEHGLILFYLAANLVSLRVFFLKKNKRKERNIFSMHNTCHLR